MKASLLFITLIFSLHVSIAAEVRDIVLKDGSTISGEVVLFDGRQYTIKSPSLGTVKLNSDQIEAIRTPSDTSPVNNGNLQQGISQNDISRLQQQILADPQAMSLIQSLQTDPQFQAVLNDPLITQAITAGDFNALLNNPKFKALMNNPVIQKIQPK